VATDLKRGVDYIGVGVCFFCHDGSGKILLHRRSKNCRDEIGNWDCGGGCIEFGESFDDAVVREIREEYGVEPLDLKFAGVRNVIRKNGDKLTHWVSLIYAAKVDPNKVIIGDPPKMDEIGWFQEGIFPEPLHSMFHSHLQVVKSAGLIKKDLR